MTSKSIFSLSWAILIAGIFLQSIQSFGAQQTSQISQPELTLREKALKENRLNEKDKQGKDLFKVDSDIQGILKLENPYRNPRTSMTRQQLGLSFRSLRPIGKVLVEGSQTFDLGQYSEQVLPHLEFALLSRRNIENTWIDWGANLSAGYFSESRRLSLQAINQEADVTFSNLIVELGPYLQIRPSQWKQFSLDLIPHYGFLQHTQNSSTSYARFSKKQDFIGVSVGPQWEIVNQWALLARYKWAQAYQPLSAPDRIEIPESAYSLGFIKKW